MGVERLFWDQSSTDAEGHLYLLMGGILQLTHIPWIAKRFLNYVVLEIILLQWSHWCTISHFLLISHNYNIENADDSFDIHKNVVLISMLIAWSKKPDA